MAIDQKTKIQIAEHFDRVENDRVRNLELRLVKFEESIPLSPEHIQKTLEGVVSELKKLRDDHNTVVLGIKEDRARQEAKRLERERINSTYDTGDFDSPKQPKRSGKKRVAENASWAAIAVTLAEIIRMIAEHLQN